MFVGLVVATCVFTGDGNAVPAPPATSSKFDVRRAVQWIFGKRSAPAKEPAPAAGQKNDGELADSRIELRCRSNVFGDPSLRATGMTVKVVGGVAYLEGVATSRWQRLRAEQLAQRTPGVQRVENQLRLEEGEIANTQPSEPPAPIADPVKTPVKTIAAEKSSPSVIASRPKSLATDSGDPAVTTYTIRRSGGKPSELQNATAEAKPTSKRNAGKLIPWNEGASPASGWLESLGVMAAAAPSPIKEQDVSPSLEPMDLAVQRALSANAHGNALTFERTGGNVVLKGSAPAAAKLKIAQDIGRIPGIATVGIDSGASDRP
jgi:hypothetical protein